MSESSKFFKRGIKVLERALAEPSNKDPKLMDRLEALRRLAKKTLDPKKYK